MRSIEWHGTLLFAELFKRLLKTYFLVLRFHHRVTFIDSVLRYWAIVVLYFSIQQMTCVLYCIAFRCVRAV